MEHVHQSKERVVQRSAEDQVSGPEGGSVSAACRNFKRISSLSVLGPGSVQWAGDEGKRLVAAIDAYDV